MRDGTRLPFGARFLLWVLPWVPVVAGCDPAPDLEWPDEAPFLERDSADVLVATTPGARARTPIGWVVDAEPEYQLGEVEGEEPYLFARIQGVRQLSYGRVAVLDGESCELRFFGPDGIFLNRAGGKGEGPGELNPVNPRSCRLVPSPVTDSLHAYDGIRLSFFDDRGRFSHRMRVSWHSARVPRVHGVARRRMLVEKRFGSVSLTGGLPQEPSTADFALLELDSLQPVWEGFFQGRQDYSVIGSTASSLYILPFDIFPTAVLGPEGFFLTLGENHGPEILEYDNSGGLRRIIRLREPGVVPSPKDLPSLVEFQLHHLEMPDTTRSRLLEVRRRRYEEMPLPEIMPVFSRLLVDDVGWLWAALYRFDVRRPMRWLVFGPNGEGLGSVDMPPGLEVWQIGQDFVLGVWQDEFGVDYVRRHAMPGRR